MSAEESNETEEKGNLWTGEEEGNTDEFRALEECDFSEEKVREATVDREALEEQLKPFDSKPSRKTLDKSLD